MKKWVSVLLPDGMQWVEGDVIVGGFFVCGMDRAENGVVLGEYGMGCVGDVVAICVVSIWYGVVGE